MKRLTRNSVHVGRIGEASCLPWGTSPWSNAHSPQTLVLSSLDKSISSLMRALRFMIKCHTLELRIRKAMSPEILKHVVTKPNEQMSFEYKVWDRRIRGLGVSSKEALERHAHWHPHSRKRPSIANAPRVREYVSPSPKQKVGTSGTRKKTGRKR